MSNLTNSRSFANNRPKGMSRQTLRIWGMLFLAAGIAGQSIIQNVILNIQSISSADFGKLLEDNNNFVMAAVAFLLQLLMACAIPIFTFLLVDGFQRTSSVKNYALRVAGVALLSEIPYNLAMTGKWIDLDSRNPMIAMALGMVMLIIYDHYSGKSFKNVMIKILVVVFSILWVEMLRINDGMAIVIMISSLWFMRKNRSLQVFGGCVIMFVCSAIPFNPTYWLAPIVFLTVHFYNEEQGEENKVLNYLMYPGLLLAIGLIAKYAI
ncbi:MAG: hypothetical protein IJW14_05005 [Oscillospiraceae bacterium]|nr:hypothetical protein [Oscillospiraceae bacterium]